MKYLSVQEYYFNGCWVKYSSNLPLTQQEQAVKALGATIISYHAIDTDEEGNEFDCFPDVKVE